MAEFIFPDPIKDFALVRTKTGRGVYASASPNYRDAIFGRDSLEVAEDVLAFDPTVGEEVLVTLASLQGIDHNPTTEEEPGRIHHEYRNMIMDGQPIGLESEAILRQLARWWGGTDTEVLYYGSVDATPLFVRLVGDYCQRYGKQILTRPVTRRDGRQMTLGESVRAAVGWIEQRIHDSRIGLVEFCRSNPHGHAYQVWKDGSTSYLHVNGQRANFDRPMAAIEVQGYAYDALMAAARLWPDDPMSALWRSKAASIRELTLGLFWMPEQQYYAEALDEEPESGKLRQVGTLTSNPALLLDTGIFDDLEKEKRQQYVGAIVRMIYSDEFVTPVGIRCRARRHAGLMPYVDYHGSWAVWTKETYDVARGLRRQGFERLAEQLEVRILNGVRLSGKHYEFWFVDEKGRVDYDPESKRPPRGKELPLITTHEPEAIQAWTISAVLAISYQRKLGQWQAGPSKPAKVETVKAEVGAWVRKLEDQLLKKLPQVKVVETPIEAEKAYPRAYYFKIDLEEGRRRRLAMIEGVSVL